MTPPGGPPPKPHGSTGITRVGMASWSGLGRRNLLDGVLCQFPDQAPAALRPRPDHGAPCCGRTSASLARPCFVMADSALLGTETGFDGPNAAAPPRARSWRPCRPSTRIALDLLLTDAAILMARRPQPLARN